MLTKTSFPLETTARKRSPRFWQPDKVEFLKENYKKIPINEMRVMLKAKSIGVIRAVKNE